jgi:hypothetical protein
VDLGARFGGSYLVERSCVAEAGVKHLIYGPFRLFLIAVAGRVGKDADDCSALDAFLVLQLEAIIPSLPLPGPVAITA